MKKVLSLLVAFVFLQTQSWALSGGPVFGSNVQSYVGSYAGVLVPETDPTTVVSTGSVAPTAAIGLFTLSQPTTGFATGVLVTFVNGAVFNGTIQGILDPDGGNLKGIVNATSSFTVGATTATATSIFAQGNIEAKVKNSNGVSGASRLTGDASLDIFFTISSDGTPNVTQTAKFVVDGFKQSDTAS